MCVIISFKYNIEKDVTTRRVVYHGEPRGARK